MWYIRWSPAVIFGDGALQIYVALKYLERTFAVTDKPTEEVVERRKCSHTNVNMDNVMLRALRYFNCIAFPLVTRTITNYIFWAILTKIFFRHIQVVTSTKSGQGRNLSLSHNTFESPVLVHEVVFAIKANAPKVFIINAFWVHVWPM